MGNLSLSEYPEHVFVFVDRSNFITAHNLDVTGTFVSSGLTGITGDNLPFVLNPSFAGALSPFLSNTIAGYRVEYDAEMARRRHAPEAPSRLTSVYAFGDEESCRLAAERHRWDLNQVEEFALVPSPVLRVRRVNMEIVSLAMYAYPRAAWSGEDIDAFWRAYWSGADGFTVELPQPPVHVPFASGCLWEYLIEGSLRLVSHRG